MKAAVRVDAPSDDDDRRDRAVEGDGRRRPDEEAR
jgi:hypothetical protein